MNSEWSSDLISEIEEAVAKALADCGRSAAWRSYLGANQAALVESLQRVIGAEHVGLASSGTAALEMVLAACRLKPGEEVLLAGYDYPGTFAAIERVGARPALVDVEENGWNLCWQSLAATVTPSCRALIASHLHGQLQRIAELERWCAEREIWLIQDACQVLGASIDSQPLGQFGDATVLSFGGGKTISAGRGGAWATRNAQLAQHARLAAGVGSGAYEMSELQAAVVRAQLPFLARITERSQRYFAHLLSEIACKLPDTYVPWRECVGETAFYQAGWIMPASAAQAGSPLIGLSQSQHAELQRIGIGSGFAGYHRRSTRRCRIDAPLANSARVAAATVTVHHRAALLDAPVGEALAQIYSASLGNLNHPDQ